ncbi:hypothetical protein H8B15_15065 [Hymenobacter sp. BT507]|uniref:Uncharacterized protein n=1 Tax=Hymenobacter citatus TaxID=2763506 RepID=A0ABR7MME1_9BACT|nr:hypothetical protein [Hymenobacter citatus]MBC6612247.1 hypothetical protein [Hymenobacter citatus]
MRENRGFTVAVFLISLMFLLVQFIENSFIGGALILGAIVIWLGLLPISIYRIITRNKLVWQKRIVPFYLLTIPFFALTTIIFIKKLIYKPDWLIAVSHDFRGSDEFRIKENGTFEYWRDSPLGPTLITKGEYTKRDSSIVLHTSEIDKIYGIYKLIIRPYIQRGKQLKKTPSALIPLDARGYKIGFFSIESEASARY